MPGFRAIAAFLLVFVAACSGPAAPADGGGDAGVSDGEVVHGPAVARVDYASPNFYDSPFPDERWRSADGTIDVTAFPQYRRVALVEQIKATARGSNGFGRSSGVLFAMSGPINPDHLPDLEG